MASSRRCTRATPSSRSSAASTRRRDVRGRERAALPALPGPVRLGHHPADDDFIGNLNYVAIAVIGGIQVADGPMSLGDVRRSSSTRASSRCRSPSSPASPTSSSRPWPRPSACSSCSTRRRRSRTRCSRCRSAGSRARSSSRTCPSDTAGDAAHRGPGPRRQAGRDGRDRGSDRRRQDDAGQPADALLRDRRRPITSTAIDIRDMTRETCAARSGWSSRTPGCSTARSATTSPTAATDATEEEIVAAAQAAHVDHFVRTLPDGYDTVSTTTRRICRRARSSC